MEYWQWTLLILILLSLASALIFRLTFLYPVNKSLALVPTPVLPDDLDQYLAQSEARVAPKKDTEKIIQWLRPDQRMTDISIVYLHGFSASRREISPVTEEIAQKIGANIYFTRLSGHGLKDEGMGKATAAEWIADAKEALAIGRRIGRKVILIGTSTGAALAIDLVKDNPSDIEALIFISANFRPKTIVSWLASGLWGQYIARLIIGRYLEFVPRNEKQAYFWTYKYSSMAITQLMELLKYINRIDLRKIRIPLLMMYTETDRVVSAAVMKLKFPQFGSPHKELFKSQSLNHVMAGDIISPEGTKPTVEKILSFLNSLPKN